MTVDSATGQDGAGHTSRGLIQDKAVTSRSDRVAQGDPLEELLVDHRQARTHDSRNRGERVAIELVAPDGARKVHLAVRGTFDVC